MTPHVASGEGGAAGSTAAERLAQWLLAGPSQIGAGVQQGAVAGSIDASGRAQYVYPEITGYYLQWLAWRAHATGAREALARRAQAAQAWLARWIATPGPPMRVHLLASEEDWRNRTTFAFDLAMVLRGLAAGVENGLLAPEPALLAAVVARLDELVADDGLLAACRASAAEALPARWSTQRGAYLAKAAAGVLSAAGALMVPERIVAAARATWHAAVGWTQEQPHADVHPLLYAYEGLLAGPTDASWWRAHRELTGRFAALLDGAGRTPLRECGASGPERIDILAQAIRVAELLARVTDSLPSASIARLRARLADCVDPSGGVPFARDAPGTRNVWAAMFASQALAGTESPRWLV